jgi:hypothetical protein
MASILPAFSANLVNSPQNSLFLFDAAYRFKYAEVFVFFCAGALYEAFGRCCYPTINLLAAVPKLLYEACFNMVIDGDGSPECIAVDLSIVIWLGLYCCIIIP